jgi:GNAT superfamily N-acetyltransferase
MAAITQLSNTHTDKHLRPINPFRDLHTVADLIETCFADNLDPDGRSYLNRMRSMSSSSGLPAWAITATSRVPMPLKGYVWEQDGRVVGNLSLIPFQNGGRRVYLIANVAVHPDYRRRGIARALTLAALERVKKKRSQSTWLQVRDDNSSAIDLYTSLGFKIRARRTTWNAEAATLEGAAPSNVRITPRRSRQWPEQCQWLLENYPLELRWHYPFRFVMLQPGLWGLLNRIFNETQIHQWAAQREARLLGVLTWQPTLSHADRLWLAAPPESEDQALQALLPFIRHERRLRRHLTLEYPAGRAVDTLQAAGFETQHTLIWMEINT